jgi:hypothetical protein
MPDSENLAFDFEISELILKTRGYFKRCYRPLVAITLGNKHSVALAPVECSAVVDAVFE